MRVIFNVKHRYALRLKSGDIFLTFLTKLVYEAKASNCSTIKGNILLYYRKFWPFVVLT